MVPRRKKETLHVDRHLTLVLLLLVGITVASAGDNDLSDSPGSEHYDCKLLGRVAEIAEMK